MTRRAVLLALTALSSPAYAAPLPVVSFEDGTLGGFTAHGSGTSAVVLGEDTQTLGGSLFELGAKGAYMARIQPDGSTIQRDAAEGLLGLTAGTFAGSGVPGLANSTNFGLITGTFSLDVGTYSFGWSYAASDYAPYDDGVFFSIAGGTLNQVNILASNFTGQTDTVIVGEYGSTPWRITSFTISEAGDYQLGFGGYNWGDDGVDPILYLDDGIGSLSADGEVVPPDGIPTIDTAEDSYAASALALGTVQPIFDGGTLEVDAAGEYDTDLVVNGAGGTIDTAGLDATFSGDFTGGGALTKSGAGVLTLTGANSYTGGTTISEGSLVGDTTSIQGNIVNNAALVFDQDSDAGFNGIISGSGSLTKTGAGALTLFAVHSYSGGTTISEGTLIGDTNSIQGDIVNNAALVISQYTSGTYAGDMSGTGTLTKSGGGAVTLTGVNSYTGGTTITGGTLIGGTTSLQGDIVNNATLGFDQDGDGTFAGAISGTGALSKTGDGAVTLTGENSYTGGTTISEGTLIGNTNSLQGDIVNNSALVFDQAGDGTFAGTISGEGTFTKTGAASLNLTGESSFWGPVSIMNGRLRVNGALGGVVTVSGGVLGGTGSIGGLVVGAGSIVAPGNSIGTLNIDGDAAFEAGSIYEVETDAAGNSDLLRVSGSVAIDGGTVSVLAEDGDYAPETEYTIITGDGGVSGTFEEVVSNLAYLTPTLGYDENNVFLTLTRNDIAFATFAVTPNQTAAASAVELLGFGNPVWDAVLGLSTDAAPAAFDSLSGEIHASVQTAIVEDSRKARAAVLDRLAEPNDGRPAVWGRIVGSWGDDDGDGNAASVDRDTTGLLTGIDVGFGENLRAGIGGGYTKTELNAAARLSNATVKTTHLLGYVGGTFGKLRIGAGVGHGWVDLDTDRTVVVGDLVEGLNADYDAKSLQSFAEVSYAAPFAGGLVSPFANISAVRVKIDGFGETGGDTALSAAARRDTFTTSQTGVRIATPESGKVSVAASLAWQHGFGTITPTTALQFAGGTPFSIAGAPMSRDAAVFDANLGFGLGKAGRFSFFYSGQLGNNGQDHAVGASLRIGF